MQPTTTPTPQATPTPGRFAYHEVPVAQLQLGDQWFPHTDYYGLTIDLRPRGAGATYTVEVLAIHVESREVFVACQPGELAWFPADHVIEVRRPFPDTYSCRHCGDRHPKLDGPTAFLCACRHDRPHLACPNSTLSPLRQTHCLRTFGAYGACIDIPGHTGQCTDAFGYHFDGQVGSCGHHVEDAGYYCHKPSRHEGDHAPRCTCPKDAPEADCAVHAAWEVLTGWVPKPAVPACDLCNAGPNEDCEPYCYGDLRPEERPNPNAVEVELEWEPIPPRRIPRVKGFKFTPQNPGAQWGDDCCCTATVPSRVCLVHQAEVDLEDDPADHLVYVNASLPWD